MSCAYSETNSRKSTFSNTSKLGEMPFRIIQSGTGNYVEGNILNFPALEFILPYGFHEYFKSIMIILMF